MEYPKPLLRQYKIIAFHCLNLKKKTWNDLKMIFKGKCF